MEGLIVFDQQNDVIYKKLNKAMKEKIYDLAMQQELIESTEVTYFQFLLEYFHQYFDFTERGGIS